MKKRGQEEIVGFVAIMVIIVVVFLVFIGLSFRSGSSVRSSKSVEQFLQSAMEYTTNCAVRYVPAYERVGGLLEECRLGARCLNEKSACEVLNDTLSKMIASGLRVGPESPINGYEFKAVYLQNATYEKPEEIISINSGNCKGVSKRGAMISTPASQGITRSSLEVCP